MPWGGAGHQPAAGGNVDPGERFEVLRRRDPLARVLVIDVGLAGTVDAEVVDDPPVRLLDRFEQPPVPSTSRVAGSG